MKIKTHVFSLKSKHPFRIAHGVRLATDTFVVELQDGYFTGFGEATPVPYYGITTESMNKVIETHRNLIEKYELDHPADYWQHLNSALSQNHFVQCAIDIAAHDLWAKKQNEPLYKTLGFKINNVPNSNYTIGIDEIPKMIMKMKEFDFPIYKIKLGTADDLNIVKALRKETDAVFRVDANCGWGVDETLHNAIELAKLNVEFIEQPLKMGEYEAMKEVIKDCALPIIADESCITENDVDKCIDSFDGINIKLAKCGGITPALRMIKKARASNLKVMMGCMTESSIGISAIAQLLPLLDYVDMDGALLIANDPAEGVKVEKGKVIYTNRNGTGAYLK
jgi:L-Ala-D/L-Glu epimerase